jgi:hypothetical protein
MTDLLGAVIEAHGGLERWRGVRAIDVRFNFSGGRAGRQRLSPPSAAELLD